MKWEKVDIGSLVTLRQGFAINKKTNHHMSEEPTTLHLLRIGDMKDGNFSVFVKETIPEKFIAREQDIIYTRTGQVGSVFRRQYGVIHNNCFTVTTNDDDILRQSFLYYALQEKSFYEEAISRATGAAQPDLPHGAFNTIQISLPPIEYQDHITAILDAYNDLIENNQKQIKLLEEAAQRLYKEWFVDLRFPGHEHTAIVDGVPEGWSRKAISELGEYINGFAFKPSDWNTKGKPIIKIKEMGSGISPDTPRNDGERVPNKYLVKSGEILFSWSATLMVMIWDNEDGWLNQHIFKVIPNKGVSREFLLQSISKAITEFSNLTTGATMKHIQRNKLDQVYVNVPEQVIMNKYNNCSLHIRERILKLSYQNNLLKESRDRLLPKLMSGEMEV